MASACLYKIRAELSKIFLLLHFTGRVTGSSQAAVAPTAAPRKVPGEGEVVLLLLLTFCALCTIGPTAGASPVVILSRLLLGAPVPAGLAAPRVRPVLVVTVLSALPGLPADGRRGTGLVLLRSSQTSLPQYSVDSLGGGDLSVVREES